MKKKKKERPQLAGLEMHGRIDNLLESNIDMTCDQVIDRRRVAAIVHLDPADAGLELEQLRHEMVDARAA